MFKQLGRVTRVATLTAVAVGALAAAPGAASAAGCTIGPTTQAFSRWGDLNQYYLAPGGSFEAPTTSWTRSGPATPVSGNEPFLLAGPKDTQSLELGLGGSVTTPPLCVSPETPHLRFVAKSNGSEPLRVNVRFQYGGGGGSSSASSSHSVPASPHGAWAPSPNVDLFTAKLKKGQTGYSVVTFTSLGDWQIDDVFVDPRASR